MKLNTFLANVNPSDIILTVNRRLGSYLKRAYDEWQTQAGSHAWQGLQIFPFDVWIEYIWNNILFGDRIILTPFQEFLLWQQCIEESPASQELINTKATANLAMDTWKVLQNWLLSLNEIQNQLSPDTQLFIAWSELFIAKCKQLHVISRHEVIFHLAEKAKFALPQFSARRILFVGFDDFSPAVQKFQDHLKKHATVLNINLENSNNKSVHRLSLPNDDQEIREMARWAYQMLMKSPKAKIGCIVPNLTEQRAKTIQTFQDVFYADHINTHHSSFPFNISAGQYLYEFPIIVTALQIITLNKNRISLEEFSCLLLSPFIGSSEVELTARALLDKALRSFGEKELFWSQLLRGHLLAPCPRLRANLECLRSLADHHDHPKSFEHWASLFISQLKALGWPGERSLDSNEFQLAERFKKLFVEFISLDFILSPVSCGKAIKCLIELTKQTLFQPKTESKPIQILGILEASGMIFDYFWVSGLNNETWPAPCTPNPFIPIELQKKLHMPHATPDRELEFSQRVTHRFLENAQIIFLSHAEQKNDRLFCASPLIAEYPLIDLPFVPYISIEQHIHESKKIVEFFDDQGPEIKEEFTQGGSGILKAQAACPFQAFAKFRLSAEPILPVKLGLAAHEKGLIIHDVLACFWEKIKSHEQLCNLNDNELITLVENLIEDALNKVKQKKPFSLRSHMFGLEKTRIQKIILSWLVLEKQRQAFEVVGCERKEKVTVGSLEISLQLDRIDQLADGSQIIIDYKTGKASIKDWFGDRPKEPQLPLYSTVFKNKPSGILFAVLKPNDMTFKGILSREGLVPGGLTLDSRKVNDFISIKELIAYWQDVLTTLANDFYHGKANVDPKEAATCQVCSYLSLCRKVFSHETC
jgi:ATP-dependent helicase/nuclease subunit B